MVWSVVPQDTAVINDMLMQMVRRCVSGVCVMYYHKELMHVHNHGFGSVFSLQMNCESCLCLKDCLFGHDVVLYN